jgi:hypothetical protein
MWPLWQNKAKIALELLIKQIGHKCWGMRKNNIHIKLSKQEVIQSDLIALYLYTIQNSINFNRCHDPMLAGRVYPFLVQIGINIDKLKSIVNIQNKLKKLMDYKNNCPLSTFYEIVVAIHYASDGWEVEFIPENDKKNPDIKLKKEQLEIYVECKFLVKDFSYKKEEVFNFNERWNKAIQDNLSSISNEKFNITFNIPIGETSFNILSDALKKLYSENSNIYTCKEVLVELEHVDITYINNQLNNNYIQLKSPTMLNLVFNEFDPYLQYRIYTVFKDISYDKQTNIEWSGKNIPFICCAKWQSLSDSAIDKKSRNVLRKVGQAVEQLNKQTKNIIHIGFETTDNPLIESKRIEKISNGLKNKKYEPCLSALFINAFMNLSTTDNYESRETTIKYIFDNTLANIINLDVNNIFYNDNNYIKGFTHWDIDNS